MIEIQNVINELIQLRASFLETESQHDITSDDTQRSISVTCLWKLSMNLNHNPIQVLICKLRILHTYQTY
jgi:hypothetical protein